MSNAIPVPDQILTAIPSPVLLVDARLRVFFANPAAEEMLGYSANWLQTRPLDEIFAYDTPLLALLEGVAEHGHSVSDYAVNIATRRGETITADIHAGPVGETSGHVVAVLHPCSVARQLDQQLANRAAARSVARLAAMLAHEVKNPLSGIRGAAQLLEMDVPEEDRQLVRLICDETDRIRGLVDRMEEFNDGKPIERQPVNVHRVLEHVRRLAENGFGRHLRLVEQYDPSLPPVDGDRDRLIQIFLNLVKNACEAAPKTGGEVRLQTHYQQGLRVGHASSRKRLELPIAVEICDNGGGISEDIAPHMFDPFISGKAEGTGLGLSLVAKIVNDHGGVVGYQRTSQGTVFRVRLPASAEPLQES